MTPFKKQTAPEKLRQIFEQVVDILDKYRLSREEIRALFRAKGPITDDERLGRVAEEIVEMLIGEELSIADVADIFKGIIERFEM